MSLNRREFMRLLAMAGAAGMAVNGRVLADSGVEYDAVSYTPLTLPTIYSV